MLDRDLAELYGVEARALKQAVRRNIENFQNTSCFSSRKKMLKSLVNSILFRHRQCAKQNKADQEDLKIKGKSLQNELNRHSNVQISFLSIAV